MKKKNLHLLPFKLMCLGFKTDNTVRLFYNAFVVLLSSRAKLNPVKKYTDIEIGCIYDSLLHGTTFSSAN